MTRRTRTIVMLAPLAVALSLASCAPATVGSPPAPPIDPASVDIVPAPPSLTAAQREPYLGSYTITTPDGERVTFRVYEESGRLKGQPAGQDALDLFHEGGDVFRSVGQYEYTLTFVVESGRATGFTARNESGVLQGVRIP